MIRLMLFSEARQRDPAVAAWFGVDRGELGAVAAHWFNLMRDCGSDVRELLHDGHPTACVGEAAFAYVNAFKDHVNVGFFLGSSLADPSGLLQGSGKFMRHVKVKSLRYEGQALGALINAAYVHMKQVVAEAD